MKIGAPFIAYAVIFREFLEKKGFDSPSALWRELKVHMKKDAPSESSVWGAFYGTRKLPEEATKFLEQRYGFSIGWQNLCKARDASGERKKSNQLSLPGMRELKR